MSSGSGTPKVTRSLHLHHPTDHFAWPPIHPNWPLLFRKFSGFLCDWLDSFLIFAPFEKSFRGHIGLWGKQSLLLTLRPSLLFSGHSFSLSHGLRSPNSQRHRPGCSPFLLFKILHQLPAASRTAETPGHNL